MLLLDALLGPFSFVDGQAIEERGGLIGFELGFLFQERSGDEKFVIRQPLRWMRKAGGVFENRNSPLLAIEGSVPIGRAIEDRQIFRFGFEVRDQAGGIAGFEGERLAARGEGALDVDGVEIG